MRIFLPVVLFLAAACTVPPSTSCRTVTEIIDGDTIRLDNGIVVRYLGIDTPEKRIKKGERWIDAPQPFSREATEANRALVLGKQVTVEYDVERRDKYGRTLGYVFSGDVLVNRALLEQGYAVLYSRPPNVKYVDELVAAQAQARREGRGLWGAYERLDAGDAGQYVGQIRSVRGRVSGTYRSSECVFLNFGKDWRTDFTVVIFNNSLPAFGKKGIDPVSFYKGKTVEVTGRIREYNGPEIIVNIPEEIVIPEK